MPIGNRKWAIEVGRLDTGEGVTQREGVIPTQQPTRIRWRMVVLLMALCFISHFNRASMAVAGTDRIMPDYGINPVTMGWVYTAFLVVYSICMIPGGVLIDRLGPRWALMLVGFSSAVLGAGTGLTGWLIHEAGLLVLFLVVVRGLMGALSAPLHPAGARMVAHWFPHSGRSFANGVVTAAAIMGVAASYPGFGKLIQWVGWPGAFVVAASVTGILSVIWMVQARDWPRMHSGVNAAEKELIEGVRSESGASVKGDSGASSDWWALLKHPHLALVTFSYATVGYFQYLFVYWMQYYFDTVLHLGADNSKYYAGILQVALALGMPLGGWLSLWCTQRWDVRRGRAWIAGGGMVASALFLAVGVLAHEPVWIVVWFAFAHVAIGASEGPIWATAVDIGGDRGGTAAAICNTGGNVGGLIAPVLTPWIGQHFGWSWGIGVGGLICFLGALTWRWIRPVPPS